MVRTTAAPDALCTLAALLLSASTASAQHYKFKTIDFDKTQSTVLKAINASSVIVGDTIDANGNDNCFVVTGSTKTTLSDPTGSTTSCAGINKAGTIVGYYVTPTTQIGFSYNGKSFTDIPGPAGSVFSQAYGISDKGTIIGTWVDSSNAQHGFLYDGHKYTSFDAPLSVATLGISINASGTYTEQGFDSNNNATSYLVTAGKPTQLIFPGSASTRVHSLNNKGEVALAWFDQQNVGHGGLYQSTTKAYTALDVPGAFRTGILGINEKQTLAGFFVSTQGGLQNGFKATGHLAR